MLRITSRWMSWVAGVVLVMAGAGCGGSAPVLLTAVSGTVTLDGKPLSGARIMFVPISSDPSSAKEALPPSSGFTDDEGRYTVATFQGQAGAAAGDHRVVVSKMATPDGKPLTSDIKDPALLGPIKETVPHKYSDPAGSELKASVGFEPEELNFELKSK